MRLFFTLNFVTHRRYVAFLKLQSSALFVEPEYCTPHQKPRSGDLFLITISY